MKLLLAPLAALLLASPGAARQARFVPLEFLDPSHPSAFSSANDLSADGTVAVGSSRAPDTSLAGVKWSLATGELTTYTNPLVDPPVEHLRHVSADGSLVFGSLFAIEYSIAFRADNFGGWDAFAPGSGFNTVEGIDADGGLVALATDDTFGATEALLGSPEGGFLDIGALPGGETTANARGLSPDGGVVVGRSGSNDGFQAFRWSATSGMQGLGTLAGDTSSEALDASRNGRVVVGFSQSGASIRAFRWTETEGLVDLGHLPGATQTRATSVSRDGRTIVGSSGGEAFLWTAFDGLAPLREHLVGLGASCLEGWTLETAAVSLDGNAFAGVGTNPDGRTQGYVAFLDAPESIPPAVPAMQTVRLGTPPNPNALVAGVTEPYVGAAWDPAVDHTSFAPGATGDVLLVGLAAENLALGAPGTLLAAPPYEVILAAPGEAFAVPVPNRCNLVGLAVHAQAASVTGSEVLLTNALDVVLGGR